MQRTSTVPRDFIVNPNSAAELEERFLDGSLTPETDRSFLLLPLPLPLQPSASPPSLCSLTHISLLHPARNAVDKYLTLLQGLLTSFIFPLTPLFFWDEHPQHSFLSPGMREETGRSVVFS
jgi:hypothetical protein